MVDLHLTILGCGSAKPTLRHHTSSQIVSRLGKLYMIDCGEGTQRQLQKYKFHEGQLENIFISHAHGDHCLGLIGLLSSMSLNSRRKDINIYIPADFEPMLKAQIDFFMPHAEYDIHTHPIDCQKPTIIHSDKHFEVTAFPLHHRVPCYGFLFREQQGKRHIKPEAIQKYNIPYPEIGFIQGGHDYTTADGKVIPNEELTTPQDLTRSYAYLSDTQPMKEYVELLQGVDLLYHDATYGEGDEQLAFQYDHSTASQAAKFARECHVGKLLLGHFSSRYNNEAWLLERAVKHFPRTIIADEGLNIKIVDKTAAGAVFIKWRE